MVLRVKKFKVRGENVLLFTDGMFLLLPVREVEVLEDGIEVEPKVLEEALDVTPDLPDRILHAAWKAGIIFSNEITAEWAVGIARSAKTISASEILHAYQ